MSSKASRSTPGIVSGKPRVVVIGAGLSGITAGIALKRDLDFHNFTIYEKADDLGGTWKHNTYPGCQSDVPTHWYSLSSYPNPNFTKSHVSQAELQKYWKEVASKYKIYPHILFNSEVADVVWDDGKQLYYIDVVDARTGRKRTDSANVVISALGSLDTPSYLSDLEGLYTRFKGTHFHSARWDHSVDFHNKRVAVIGNGCSASQLVPILAKDPTTQIVSFCRQPKWIVPNSTYTFPTIVPFLFRTFPFMLRLFRWSIMLKHEMMYLMWFAGGQRNKQREKLMNDLRKYMKATAPEEYHSRIIPEFPFGCQRLIMDYDYLSALKLPNNDVNYDGIAEITEKGIITKKGDSYDFDIIVQATGFNTNLYPLKATGIGGKTLQEYHMEKGGPTAYHGMATPGFPNLYLVAGPNSLTGHASAIFGTEIEINYIKKMIEPVLKGQAASFEITTEATDNFDKQIQKRLGTSVWSFCDSWYRVGHNKKISALWPGTMIERWWALRNPVWGDYVTVGAEQWERKRRLDSLWFMMGVTGLVAVFVWMFINWGVMKETVDTYWPVAVQHFLQVWNSLPSLNLLGKA